MNFFYMYLFIYTLVDRGAIIEKLKVVVGAFFNLDTHDKQFPYISFQPKVLSISKT